MQRKTKPLTDLQQRQAARRIAAATVRINEAKRLGPRATIDAVRRCLVSAVRVNPDPSIVGRYADDALAAIRELYTSPRSGQ
jgi:hypothetical protein